jgi:hypothetical protein
MTKVFISYAVEDDAYKDKLQRNLRVLVRQGIIEAWDQELIDAGQNRDARIKKQLEKADLILLLVSPDYLASDSIFNVELKLIMERSVSKDRPAEVVPVILRPCDWTGEVFAKKNVLPPDARPLSTWENEDEAYLSINEAIKKLLNGESSESKQASDIQQSSVSSDKSQMLTSVKNSIGDGKMKQAFDVLGTYLKDTDSDTYSEFISIKGRQSRYNDKVLKQLSVKEEEQEGIVKALLDFLKTL